MEEIINEGLYLPQELVYNQLRLHEITHINKTATGNGATYSWLNVIPRFDYVNIIIEPNVSAIKSKELEAQREGKTEARQFVYEGNPIDLKNKKTKHLVITSDGFVHNHKEIFKAYNIHAILVDEFHQVVQSASYRGVMARMMAILENKKDKVLIGTITATPMLNAKIDVKIINELQEWRTIIKSHNLSSTIENINIKLQTGEHVMLFLNDAKLAAYIMSRCNRSDIQLKSGSAFRNTLFKTIQTTINETSNLQIISSNGYEGWDGYISNVFTFACYSNRYTSMLVSNMVQCNGRPRKGVLYSEHCIYEAKHTDSNPINHLREKAETLVNSKGRVTDKQKTNARFRFGNERVSNRTLRPYIIFDNSSQVPTLSVNEMAIDKEEEIIATRYNTDEIVPYLEACKVRMVSNNKPYDNYFNPQTLHTSTVVNNIVFNIENNNLTNKEIHDLLYSTRLIYLNEKEDYQREYNVAISVKNSLGLDYSKEAKALNLISSKDFKSTIFDLFSKKKKDINKNDVLEAAYKFSYQIISKRQAFKIRGHRNYNPAVSLSTRIIEYISKGLDLRCVELDIKSAFPSIIFNQHGINEVPEDFYGVNGEKKVGANVLLNTLHSEVDQYKRERTKKGLPNTKKDVDIQRNREINRNRKKLNKLYPENITESLINEYTIGNYDKAKFFNNMSFVESRIIGTLWNRLEQENAEMDYFMTTKHDAILVMFEPKKERDIIIPSMVNYNGKNDWFRHKNIA
tara:strand:+ start:1128 stop:3353 length:2226 start_codon:yes stop_codon:yes gene_type:complete